MTSEKLDNLIFIDGIKVIPPARKVDLLDASLVASLTLFTS
jgi:hypothetical protein